MKTPFFSIGVTTYNRRELLKQTLDSIAKQTFQDFEVIIGNDYPPEPISAELLGIDDPRIYFVNHPQNMGEVANMNLLLGMGHGRYFTWFGDDDLYAPDFLQFLHVVLARLNYPPCIFTSYGIISGTSFPELKKYSLVRAQLFSGHQFLRMYLNGKLKTIGPYGVFDTKVLRQIGGIKQLCDAPIGLYGEYLLLIQSGLFEKVAYLKIPLILVRDHEGSWAGANTNIALHKQAGANLIRESIPILLKPELREEFGHNFSFLLRRTSNTLVGKLAGQNRYRAGREMMGYLFVIKGQIVSLKGSGLYWRALASLNWEGVRVFWLIARLKFKAMTPVKLVRFARTIRKIFSPA